MVKKLEAPLPTPKRRKRVAAYARVSMDTEMLMHSLSEQISYYSDLIQNTPEWEYAGIYADRGISGTSTVHRDELNRLLADCEAGKVDIILTKSISRFARNTVDLLSIIRHLKEIGVEVRFEREHINTFSGDGELMLSILASFAQAEAQSISDNVKWGIQKNFEQGIPNGHKRMLGYEWDGEKYIIVPDEAEIVRRIFNEYNDGFSSVQIAKGLNADSLFNIEETHFSDAGIRYILDNVDYTGDLLLQKRYSPSIGKRKINRGEVQQYLVEEAQEPIINHELFEAVQEKRRKKADEMPDKNVTCFSGKLICGYCGSAVCRRNVANGKPQWICNGQDKKGVNFCGGRRLSEPELISAVTDVLGDDYEKKLDDVSITVYDDRLEFDLKNQSNLKNQSSPRNQTNLKNRKRKIWKRHFLKEPHARSCFTKKIHCGRCGEIFRRESTHGYISWICKNHKNNHRRSPYGDGAAGEIVSSGTSSGEPISHCENISTGVPTSSGTSVSSSTSTSSSASTSYCEMKPISEDILIKAAQKMFGRDYEMKVHTEVNNIIVSDKSFTFYCKSGEERSWQR